MAFMEESRDIDDVLTLKLSIEPTEATTQSLNELAGLADDIMATIAKTAQAFDLATEQRKVLEDTLVRIDADRHVAQAQGEVDGYRPTARETLDTVATAELTHADMMPPTFVSPQATVITHDQALDRAATYESLTARGLEAPYEQVSLIADRGGIDSALANTLDRENGSVLDQLNIVAARFGQTVLDTITGSRDDIGIPRFAQTLSQLPDETIERMVQASVETAESTKKLADKTERDELQDRGVAPAPTTPDVATEDGAPERPARPSRQARPAQPKPSKPPKIPELPTDDKRRFTAGQQIEGLLGVSQRDSIVGKLQSRAGRLGEFGEKLGDLHETLNPKTPLRDADGNFQLDNKGQFVFAEDMPLLDSEGNLRYDDEGNVLYDAARIAGLVNAGSRFAGMTGLGRVGATAASIGSGVVSTAARIAPPLALAYAGMKALEAGFDFYNDTSIEGYAVGETGYDAFKEGFDNKVSDWGADLSFWNRTGSREQEQFRRSARNNPYGIAPGTDEYETLINLQREANERGLNPNQIMNLYGERIARDPNPFYVNDELDRLAEAAKNAGVSVEAFATQAQSAADNLERQFGIVDENLIREHGEILNRGIFDPNEGLFGKQDDRTKSKILSSTFDYSTSEGMRAARFLREDDDIMGQLEAEGIELSDTDAILMWAVENLTPEQKDNLITGVYTEGMPTFGDQTSKKRFFQQRHGISVDSTRLSGDLPEYEGIGSAPIAPPGYELGLPWFRSESFGEYERQRFGETTAKPETTVNIRLSDGLIADVTTAMDNIAVSQGKMEYEEVDQSGRPGSIDNNPKGR